MSRNLFTIIFIIATAAILILVDYFNKIEFLSRYLVIVILAAYNIGQYSTRFSKKAN
jgi:hypothetical protein